jgi:predicted MFS family arabinose efflux permease
MHMDPERRAFRRAVVLGVSVSILGAIPPKLTGALSPQIAQDLSFSAATLGTIIAVLHSAGALASIPLGRLADRLGSTRSIRLAAAASAVAFLGVALLATSWLTLVALLAVGQVAGKLGGPAANRLLVGKIPARRLGAAFGIKQSAGPIAGMIAGLSVPLIGVTLGWRWAYAIVGFLAVMLILLVRRSSPGKPRVREAKPDKTALPHRSVLGVLALAFGLQGAATTLLAVFYVPSAVDAGIAAGTAGLLLAVSSGLAMLVRVMTGRLVDRMESGHLRVAAGLLGVGTIGIVLLAIGSPATMIIGIGLALGAAWGQPGVFWFALVRFYKDTPGRVTGLISPANSVGSIVGPFVFGLLVAWLGYSFAWVFCAALAALAAVAMLSGNRRIAAVTDPQA